MTYGIKIINGQNRTLIDENTGLAVVSPQIHQLPRTFLSSGTPITQWAVFSVPYLPKQFPYFQVDAAVRELGAYSDVQGLANYQHNYAVNALRILYNKPYTIPTYLPARNVAYSNDVIRHNLWNQPLDSHGLRVRDGSNQVVFDSSFEIAVIERRGALVAGQNITLPAGTWLAIHKCPSASARDSLDRALQLRRLDATTFRIKVDVPYNDTNNTRYNGEVVGLYSVLKLT